MGVCAHDVMLAASSFRSGVQLALHVLVELFQPLEQARSKRAHAMLVTQEAAQHHVKMWMSAVFALTTATVLHHVQIR